VVGKTASLAAMPPKVAVIEVATMFAGNADAGRSPGIRREALTVAVLVIAIVIVSDLRGAIGFSSFGVLTYHALANAAAWTLPAADRRLPRGLAGFGVVACLVLAVTLPLAAVIGGGDLLVVGPLA
jgi:hypothetical protein